MRISRLDLNNIKTALVCRSVALADSVEGKSFVDNPSKISPFGEDTKKINQRTLKPVLLSPVEQTEVVAKYESGMSMTAIADQYGCHYTTIGRILRRRGTVLYG